ncbi:MobQ family relaxase [Halalkalibacter flavus]|uniref:MobQ family relaxase n=1 Tax=Halalkalibacter flavus TaxID=3090668 RepID=UPI002FC9D6EA
MAIYHFSGQVIKRSAGRSSVACASYRSGEKLTDERENKTFDFRREVQPDSFILLPEHAPKEYMNREVLWNAVEKSEKRMDAQVAREFNVALPVELSHKQQKSLTTRYVQEQFVNRGMIADVAIHRDDPANPHFHVMLSMRPLNKDGTWGKKREGNKKVVNWDERITLETWRKEWSTYANRELERAGRQERIDHRSLKEQGIQRLPQVHMGRAAAIEQIVKEKAEREGKVYVPVTRQAIYNQLVQQYNMNQEKLQEMKRETEKQPSIMTKALDRHVKTIVSDEWYWKRMNAEEQLAVTYVANRIKEPIHLSNLEQSMKGIYAWEASLEQTREELQREREQGEDRTKDIAKWEKTYEEFLKVSHAYETTKQSFERLSLERVVADYNEPALKEQLNTHQAAQVLQYNRSFSQQLAITDIPAFLKEQQAVSALQLEMDRSMITLQQAVAYRERLGGLDYRVHLQAQKVEEASRIYGQHPNMMNRYYMAKEQTRYQALEQQLQQKQEVADRAIDVLYAQEKMKLEQQGVSTKILERVSARDYVKVEDYAKLCQTEQQMEKLIKEKTSYDLVKRRLQGEEINVQTVSDLKEKIDRWGKALERKEAELSQPSVALSKERERHEEQREALQYVYNTFVKQQKEQLEGRVSQPVDQVLSLKELELLNKQGFTKEKEIQSFIQEHRATEIVKSRLKGEEVTPQHVAELKEAMDRWGASIARREAVNSQDRELMKEREQYSVQKEAVDYLYHRFMDQQKKQLQEHEGQLFAKEGVTLKEMVAMNQQPHQSASEVLKQVREKDYLTELNKEIPRASIQNYIDLERVQERLNTQKEFIHKTEKTLVEKEDHLSKVKVLYERGVEKQQQGQSNVKEVTALQKQGYQFQRFNEQYNASQANIQTERVNLKQRKEQMEQKENKLGWLKSHMGEQVEKRYREEMKEFKSGYSVLDKAILLNEKQTRTFEAFQANAVLERGHNKLEAIKAHDRVYDIKESFDKRIQKQEKEWEKLEKSKASARDGYSVKKIEQQQAMVSAKIEELQGRERKGIQAQVNRVTEGRCIGGLKKEESERIITFVESTGHKVTEESKGQGFIPADIISAIDASIQRAQNETKQRHSQQMSQADRYFNQNKKHQRGKGKDDGLSY